MTAMGLKIYAGRTFHIPTPPAGKFHLWVAVTDPDGNPEKVVIVNLTTQQSNSDTTVILSSSDHPFVKHPTVISYVNALFPEVTSIQRVIENGISRFDEDCASALLERIQSGLLTSPFTPKNIKNYCRKFFFNY